MLPSRKPIKFSHSQGVGQSSVLLSQHTSPIELSNTILLFNIGEFLQAISELGQPSSLVFLFLVVSRVNIRFPLADAIQRDNVLFFLSLASMDS